MIGSDFEEGVFVVICPGSMLILMQSVVVTAPVVRPHHAPLNAAGGVYVLYVRIAVPIVKLPS